MFQVGRGPSHVPPGHTQELTSQIPTQALHCPTHPLARCPGSRLDFHLHPDHIPHYLLGSPPPCKVDPQTPSH